MACFPRKQIQANCLGSSTGGVAPLEQCRMMDESSDDPGVSIVWGSSDARGVFGGGPGRGA